MGLGSEATKQEGHAMNSSVHASSSRKRSFKRIESESDFLRGIGAGCFGADIKCLDLFINKD